LNQEKTELWIYTYGIDTQRKKTQNAGWIESEIGDWVDKRLETPV